MHLIWGGDEGKRGRGLPVSRFQAFGGEGEAALDGVLGEHHHLDLRGKGGRGRRAADSKNAGCLRHPDG